jgi:NADPH-dependent curcumin reductase CurA
VLGLNGVTALIDLTVIGEPKPGETVLVSTAAGADSSAVGQIAKILDCRAVEIAGGENMVAQCLKVSGYNAAIDYEASGPREAINKACPNGVNVYFDNMSGVISVRSIRGSRSEPALSSAAPPQSPHGTPSRPGRASNGTCWPSAPARKGS